MLTSSEHATQVWKPAPARDIRGTLPVVEFSGFLVEDYRAEQRLIELREQLHRQADQIAQHILEGGKDVQAWADAVSAFRASLEAARGPVEFAEQARQHKEVLTEVTADLAELLARPT